LLDKTGKACKGQTLYLITKNHKSHTKMLYNIGPWLHIWVLGKRPSLWQCFSL